MSNADNLPTLTAQIVAAFVAHNPTSPSEIPNLIGATYKALKTMGEEAPQQVEELRPAVPVRKSVTPDFIFCLEDGKKFKSLKRHLRTHYDLSPEQYREKWGLPADYPMVAPSYSATRSNLAKVTGLGLKSALDQRIPEGAH
jgi:predicted transcriptional regulator